MDIEGHQGRDRRYYVLDTARLFPPATPIEGYTHSQTNFTSRLSNSLAHSLTHLATLQQHQGLLSVSTSTTRIRQDLADAITFGRLLTLEH